MVDITTKKAVSTGCPQYPIRAPFFFVFALFAKPWRQQQEHGGKTIPGMRYLAPVPYTGTVATDFLFMSRTKNQELTSNVVEKGQVPYTPFPSSL